MIVSEYLMYFFLFFMVALYDRVRNTFFKKSVKKTKIIVYKWLFFLPLFSYLLIVMHSIKVILFDIEFVNLTLSFSGGILYMIGTILRRKAIYALGNNWSPYIEIKEGHEVIRGGIYKYLSHPYCLAVLFELVGFSLIANATFSLILILIIQIPLLAIRIFVEERVLVEGLTGYSNYRKFQLKV